MPEPGPLDSQQWRIFRLFLAELEDDQLDQVRQQLHGEIKHRRDCQADITRLFFSSLDEVDLEAARQTLLAERRARVQDRRKLRGSRATTRRPP